jgi:hypothetical protein
MTNYMHIHTGSVATKSEWISDIENTIEEKFNAENVDCWSDLSEAAKELMIAKEFEENFKPV